MKFEQTCDKCLQQADIMIGNGDDQAFFCQRHWRMEEIRSSVTMSILGPRRPHPLHVESTENIIEDLRALFARYPDVFGTA